MTCTRPSLPALAVLGAAGGDAAPIAWMLLVVAAGTWTWIVLATDRAIASDRARAWRWALRFPPPPAAGDPVRVRIDGSGLSFAAGGLFMSFDWSEFIQVVGEPARRQRLGDAG